MMQHFVVHLLLVTLCILFGNCASINIVQAHFQYLMSNYSPTPIPPTYFLGYQIGYVPKQYPQTASDCAYYCMIYPLCFMFCFVPGECAFGIEDVTNTVQVQNTIQLNTSNNGRYECYSKLEFYEAITVGYTTAYPDIALNHNATLSSYLNAQTNPASLCIDSLASQAPADCCSTASAAESQPYLLIDLQSSHLVLSIRVFNQMGDNTQNRLHDLEIRVGNQPYDPNSNSVFQLNSICYDYDSVGDSVLFESCSTMPLLGQYVSLQIVRPCGSQPNCYDPKQNTLNICEVQIFGFNI